MHILSLSVAELSKQTIIETSARFLPELVSVLSFPFKLILSLTLRQMKIHVKTKNKEYGEGWEKMSPSKEISIQKVTRKKVVNKRKVCFEREKLTYNRGIWEA